LSLIRIFLALDDNRRIVIPRGICKALSLKSGDKLELTVMGGGSARETIMRQKRRNK